MVVIDDRERLICHMRDEADTLRASQEENAKQTVLLRRIFRSVIAFAATVAISILGGVYAFSALQTDVTWIKGTLMSRYDERISELEDIVSPLILPEAARWRNEHVDPKLQQLENDLVRLRSIIDSEKE